MYYYVFDIYGIGATDIYDDYSDTQHVDRLTSIYADIEYPDCVFVGKYDTYEDALEAAEEYESEVQDEVNYAVGNDEDGLTAEDYLLEDED